MTCEEDLVAELLGRDDAEQEPTETERPWLRVDIKRTLYAWGEVMDHLRPSAQSWGP